MKKLFLIIGIFTLIFIIGCTKTEVFVDSVCTKEAKVCPDGSSVGRTGPNCEFAKCQNSTAIANPASVFCEQKGGKVEIITSDDGSQKGNCILSNGTRCDEWEYFRGGCFLASNNNDNNTINCPRFNPPRPDFCTDGKIVSDIDANGCETAPRCERNSTSKIQTICGDKRPEACTMDYNPVCGYFNKSIKCFAYPCGATYGNACTACADTKVEYWEKGECPPPESDISN